MEDYEAPELVELGDVLELTLGQRPGDDYDQSEFYPPVPGCCCGGCGGPIET